MTVSGHTGTSSPWWPLAGGIVLVLVAGAGFVFLRTRRGRPDAAPAPGLHPGFAPDDADEPSP